MIRKKIINIVTAAAVILQLIPGTAAFAAEYGETKTELVNVAKFKPVSTSRGPVDSTLTNLVDDHNDTDLIVSYSNGEQWIKIDLQRRFKISHIEIASRCTSANSIWLSDFEIQASNDESFSKYQVLDSCLSQDGESLPKLGSENMTFNGSEDTAYRYVRVYANHMMGFSEIRIYANQTVTQINPVSAKAGTIWENNSLFSGEKAAYGDISTTWVGEYSSKYDFLRLDFGEKYNVGFIELYPRQNGDEHHARTYFKIYGSEDISGISDEDNLTVKELSEYGYNELAYLKNPAGEMTDFDYNPFPSGGKFSASLDESKAYRYITFKKSNTQHAQLSEMKLYAVNPVINKIQLKDEMLVLEFSDEMEQDAMEKLLVTDLTESDEAECSGYFIDEYTYAIDISALNKAHKYEINAENVTNIKGTPAKGKITLNSLTALSAVSFDYADKDGNSFENIIEAENTGAKAEVLNIGEDDKAVMLAAAIYEDGQLKSVSVENKTIPAGESDTLSVYNESVEERLPGRVFKAFLWDVTEGRLSTVKENLYMTEKISYDIYASADGEDTAIGTTYSPCSLMKAQELVREINSDMEKDINVYLSSGVYKLNDVWRFDENDGGKNGYRVNYISDGDVIISGGEEVSGWEKIKDNLYGAPYSGKSRVHELYVNGVKAKRAAYDEKVQLKGFYYSEDGSLKGILADVKYSELQNANDMQAHFARGWRSMVCNVRDIIKIDDKTAAFVMGDELTKAVNIGAHAVKENSTFYLENVFEGLDEPGEFYYNEKENYIYYMTDSSDMSKSQVIVPVLEQLVDISGSNLSNKVKNITFNGLTFAHCAWNYPMDNGYVGGQAQSFTGESKKTALDELGVNIVDAAVQIRAAEGIEIINGELTGLAKVGVGLYKGASNNRIEGNAFYSLGDSAVTVGLPSDNYMEPEYEGYNLAFNKVCTSTNSGTSYPAYNATDGNAKEGWSAESVNGSHLNAWWQVDLGDEYEIDRIEIDARTGYDQITTRRYFEILASNDPEFSDGGKVIAKAGSRVETNDAFGIGETWSQDVEDSGKYRYIRLRKTINEYMYLAEIRVINLSMGNILQKEVCKNNKIYNNYITAIGEFNYGAPGIQTYYTENVDIANNHIVNVPYTGIGLGWGWNIYKDSVANQNNKVRNNIIDNFALINLDAGGIYTLGQQPGAEISGNYVKNQNNAYGAIYPDNGSKDYSVTGNVLENIWVSFFVSTDDKENITFTDNYSTTTSKKLWGKNCTETNTKYFVSGDMPEDVQKIADSAGLMTEYKWILEKVKINPHTYSSEEIFDNVKHEVSGSMTDTKLASYYLKDIIEGAETVLDNADSNKYPQEEFEELKEAIANATAEYQSIIADINAAIQEGQSGTSAIIDRDRVFNAKLALDSAVKKFINSKE